MTDEEERHQFLFVPNARDQLIAYMGDSVGKEMKSHTLIKIS